MCFCVIWLLLGINILIVVERNSRKHNLPAALLYQDPAIPWRQYDLLSVVAIKCMFWGNIIEASMHLAREINRSQKIPPRSFSVSNGAKGQKINDLCVTEAVLFCIPP